jgi:hypothetical protein
MKEQRSLYKYNSPDIYKRKDYKFNINEPIYFDGKPGVIASSPIEYISSTNGRKKYLYSIYLCDEYGNIIRREVRAKERELSPRNLDGGGRKQKQTRKKRSITNKSRRAR